MRRPPDEGALKRLRFSIYLFDNYRSPKLLASNTDRLKFQSGHPCKKSFYSSFIGRLKKCFAETLHKDVVMQFAPQERRREENGERQRVDDWLMKTVSKMGLGLIGSKTKTNVPSLFRELMNEEEKRGLLTINANSAHICRQEQCILVEVTLSYFPSIKKENCSVVAVKEQRQVCAYCVEMFQTHATQLFLSAHIFSPLKF